MMQLELDLLKRRISSRGFWLSLPSFLCIFGMSLGVACLTAAMGLVSGFERTLRDSIQDVYGHVIVLKRVSNSPHAPSLSSIIGKLKGAAPEIKALTPFLQLEGLLAGKGKVSGVLLQGMQASTLAEVLKISPRVIQGDLDLGSVSSPKLVVGKGIQKKYQLVLGQEISFVLPVADTMDPSKFTPRVQKFVVAGVVDLGKNEYNERFVLTELAVAQSLAHESSDFISGWRMALHDPNDAEMVTTKLSDAMGPSYFLSSWVDASRNLFEAIRVEKPVLFIILSVMVLAASFNLASHLFLSVYRRFSDISILATLGMRPVQILRLYILEGLVFSCAGLFFGMLLGGLFCVLFLWVQKVVVLLPPDVYRIDNVGVDIRGLDLLSIAVVALFISMISIIFPARKAARLSPVEGLRYE